MDRAKEELRGDAAVRQQPGWLGQLARITATGEVCACSASSIAIPEKTFSREANRGRSLYHDLDTDPMAAAFTGWHVRRHGTEPDPEAVGALAEEWMEGPLPDTWYAVSPHRVEFQLALINDWIPDDPITVAAKALLPEWVRWHGEQTGLPEHLVDRGVAVASGGVRSAPDCAGHRM